MNEITFGRLQDLPPREAWAHETLAFTPWLAANIDHLAEAIGIPLELTGQEVRVETFAADILARNPQDGSVVLIENQLETTDHTHLGQIMTYLAGLEAQTVVWIAPSFREPHLSAIRWLNEHTADGFAFFAVRLRVVRIADSPYAPIFEVIEKPNDWDRQIAEQRSSRASGDSELGTQRHAYWTAYQQRHPGAEDVVSRLSYFSAPPEGLPDVTVCVWIGQREGGIFVRGLYGEERQIVADLLAPHAEWLEARLGIPLGTGKHHFTQRWPGGLAAPESWAPLIDWQEEQRLRYLAAFNDLAETLTT